MHPHYEQKHRADIRVFAVRLLQHLNITDAQVSTITKLVEFIEVMYPASACVACSNQLPDMLCDFHTAELSGHLKDL